VSIRLRPLLGSTALHAGVLCGLGVWLGIGLGRDPRPQVRFGIERDRAPVRIVETVDRPDEHIEVERPAMMEPLPEPLTPQPDPSHFEAPRGTPDPIPLREPPPLVDLLVRVRPPVPPPTPEVAPPLPVALSYAEAELCDDNEPPSYPRRSIARGEHGVVWLLLAIDAGGRVTSVTLEQGCGHPRLHRAAIEAARAWTFEPARRDGAAVASEKRIPVEFRLESPPG
jgi:protein TonB